MVASNRLYGGTVKGNDRTGWHMIDYVFLFANQAAAQADAAVGAYWLPGNADWRRDVVITGISVSTPTALVFGISTLTGFWIMVCSTLPNAALAASPNLVLALDRDAAINGHPFVAATPGLSGTGRTSATFAPVPMGSKYPIPLGQ